MAESNLTGQNGGSRSLQTRERLSVLKHSNQDMTNDAQDSWSKFLEPGSLRVNLVITSLFIAAYETLKDSIIQQLKEFYTHGFDENGPIVSPSYDTKVLALDVKRNPFRASIVWLKTNGVIDEADVRLIDELRQHRNEVAHELPKFLSEVGKDVQIPKLAQMQQLVTKIDRWWIVNVELETQDEIDPAQVKLDEIISGRMLFLDLMIGITTGTRYTDLYGELQKVHQMRGQNTQAKDKGPLCS